MIEQLARDLKKLGLKIPCSFEVLTPVHIGSGVKLQKDLDFVSSNDTTTIVSQDVLFAHLEADPVEQERFLAKQSLRNLRKIPPGRSHDIYCSSNDIFEYIRDGMAQPYLPGSSLKGALRTVLFNNHWVGDSAGFERQINDTIRRRPSKTWASQSIQKTTFGSEPNNDLLRVLVPGDAYLQEASIKLYEVLILNLRNAKGEEAGWKNVPARRTGTDIFDATPIFAEMATIGAQGNFSLRLDQFLLEGKAANKLNFGAKKFSLEDLSVWANRHARSRIAREIAFLKKITNLDLADLFDDLEWLLQQVPEVGSEEEKQAFVLRMGWGSGWESMTGDLLQGATLDSVRKEFRLGKFGMPFPKTRKIILKGDTPTHLCGFIKIRLNHQVSEKAAEVEATQPAHKDQKDSSAPGGSEEGATHENATPDSGQPRMLAEANADTTGIPARIIKPIGNEYLVYLHVKGYEGVPVYMVGDPGEYESGGWVLVKVTSFIGGRVDEVGYEGPLKR